MLLFDFASSAANAALVSSKYWKKSLRNAQLRTTTTSEFKPRRRALALAFAQAASTCLRGAR